MEPLPERPNPNNWLVRDIYNLYPMASILARPFHLRMDVRVRVGKNVLALRKERTLTQEELAHRAAINQTYLSDIERGKRNPSLLVLDRIASALDADLEQLVRRP